MDSVASKGGDGSGVALLYAIGKVFVHAPENRHLKRELWNAANTIVFGNKLHSKDHKKMWKQFCQLMIMYTETRKYADSYRGMQILNLMSFDLKAQLTKDNINYTKLELCLIDRVVSRRPDKKVELSALAQIFMQNSCPMSTKVFMVQYLSMLLAHPSYKNIELSWETSTGSPLSVLLNMLNHTYLVSSITSPSEPLSSPSLLTLSIPSSSLQSLLILPSTTIPSPSPAPTVQHLHQLLMPACSLALR